MPSIRQRLTTLRTVVLCSLLLIIGSGCEPQPSVQQQQFLALGTLIDLSLYGADKQQTEEAVKKISVRMEQIHHDWHAWQAGKLSQLNQQLQAGQTVELSDEQRALIASGIQLAAQSEQRFNPAAGKLIGLWGFHSDERPADPPPSEQAIKNFLQHAPSMAQLTLTGNTLSSSNPQLQLDVGGYAKGYAVDEAIRILREMGIDNAIVNAGGDLRAIGDKHGQAWRIGIRHPRKPGVIASIEVSGDESVFTSGDYERYFEYHGQRYHHIIDPQRGHPARGVSSVTIIHTDATTADAAATALFIAGVHDWPRIAKQMQIDHAMLIDESGIIHMTPKMQARVHFEDGLPHEVNVSP